jgi:protein-tyrosine phosphatase
MSFPIHISTILDNQLYLGSQCSSTDDELLKNNIYQVISIGCNPMYTSSLIHHYKFDIEDNGNTNNVYIFFNEIIPQIHFIMNTILNHNQKVLVHCQAGISRSAIVIITWLMKYHNMNYETAHNYVKEKRPIISPNISFVEYIQNKQINK